MTLTILVLKSYGNRPKYCKSLQLLSRARSIAINNPSTYASQSRKKYGSPTVQIQSHIISKRENLLSNHHRTHLQRRERAQNCELHAKNDASMLTDDGLGLRNVHWSQPSTAPSRTTPVLYKNDKGHGTYNAYGNSYQRRPKSTLAYYFAHDYEKIANVLFLSHLSNIEYRDAVCWHFSSPSGPVWR